MKVIQQDEIRKNVRERYSEIAKSKSSCCSSKEKSAKLGYTDKELSSVPDGSNMGLGCGNPSAIASLKKGDVVLDLGSGGGFDCFLASKQVGNSGKVIGIDMTPDMVSKARNNAVSGNYHNVEFRLGEIEYLPVADNSIDVIISNCVINLSPDKQQVYNEAFRVLKKGGRIVVSDVVALHELPEEFKKNLEAYSGCLSGAATVSENKQILKNAGFSKVDIELKEESKEFIKEWFPGSGAENYIVSSIITAIK